MNTANNQSIQQINTAALRGTREAHQPDAAIKGYGTFKIEGYGTFKIEGYGTFKAEDVIDDILVNPKLPSNFDNTANEARPAGHRKFLNLPYIQTYSESDFDPSDDTDQYADARRKAWAESGRAAWFKAWPSGIRYDVRCLDGGAWDRPTNWGCFATIDEAVGCARTGPAWWKD